MLFFLQFSNFSNHNKFYFTFLYKTLSTSELHRKHIGTLLYVINGVLSPPQVTRISVFPHLPAILWPDLLHGTWLLLVPEFAEQVSLDDLLSLLRIVGFKSIDEPFVVHVALIIQLGVLISAGELVAFLHQRLGKGVIQS